MIKRRSNINIKIQQVKYTLFAVFFGLISSLYSQNDSSTHKDSVKTISIIGVGDIMLGTNFPSAIYLPRNNDCQPLLAQVNRYLQNANISFANIEGCFSDTAKLEKKCSDTTKCFAFRMPVHYFECLKEAGFDVFSLANNHSGDFGLSGRLNTIQLINDANLHFAGLTEYPYIIFEKDSIRYGFCAFSPNKGTSSITDTVRAKEIVRLLHDSCDIVIASMHGGAEGKDYQHVTRKTEEFYGENRGNVYEFAHMLIDAGADVIFGHGPHVTRAIELYKKRFIIYSLGNFCTYGRFNLKGPNGIAPIIKIYTTTSGEFVKGEIFPVMQYNYITEPDPEKRVIKKIIDLTNSDFPESKISISEGGIITHKYDN